MNPLYNCIQTLAKEDSSGTALIACDEHGKTVETISRGELLKRIDAAREKLAGRTDPLVLEGTSTPEFLISCWAAWCAGITVVPLDVRRDTVELREYKQQLSLKAQPSDALILFTSGTTARPKGARLTLESLMVNASAINDWLHISRDDRFMVVLPLYHINSTTFSLAALTAGASIVLTPGYSNSHFWEATANSGATLTSIVQSIVYDQLQRTKEFDTHKNKLKLTRMQIGSAPVIPHTALEFMHTFAIPLYQGYGQTETALRVTGVPMDIDHPLYERLVEENSIGTPMSWADLQIADEHGSLLKEGEEGELVVRGPAVMQGYVGGEEAFRNGYFCTGDVGYFKVINGRKYFYLRGRKSELIIKGGVNISPAAVENSLKKISPDIEQAYAVGVHDDRYGEEVGVTIVWRTDQADANMRRLKWTLMSGTKLLSVYETPKYFATLTAAELPLTSTGKVQRVFLKKQIPPQRWQTLHTLHQSNYRFVVLTPHSPLREASRALYNHCWQPLEKNIKEYGEFLDAYITIAALDGERVAGQITIDTNQNKLSCISICSATYTPKPTPHVDRVPTPKEVRAYAEGGHDGVYNFHHNLGAELVELVPQGRPEDMSACGYTMLMRYPAATNIAPTEGASVSQQLIELVRLLGHDTAREVYAVSRPGGLAAYISRVI